MAIQIFDDAQAAMMLPLNGLTWGILPGGGQNKKSKNQKILKYEKLICSGKENLKETRCKCF